jgi:hypothetical protein
MSKYIIRQSQIKYVKGDLFNFITDRIHAGLMGASVVVPHVCNNKNIFGGGFTSSINKHFPLVKHNFDLLGNNVKLGTVQYVSVLKENLYKREIIFANMIAQNGTINKENSRPLNYHSLMIGMVNIKKMIMAVNKEKDDNIEIHAPKFGSGLAGGNWRFIEHLIEDIWQNIPVFIYTI